MSFNVNIDDIIQYRYRHGGFIHHDARRVEMIDDKGYWVTGGYHIPATDVLSVIRAGARESAPVEKRPFPLEAGQ